jgi:hypothetical protein
MVQKKTDIAAKGAPSPEGSEADHEREDYAEHLARVTPDADRNKALLQARYKALHDAEPDNADSH